MTVGVRAMDNAMQAEISDCYAAAAENHHRSLARAVRSIVADEGGAAMFDAARQLALSVAKTGGRAETVHRACLQTRAERDMWRLLEILARADLLQDVNDEQNAQSLDAALSRLSPNEAGVPDYVNTVRALGCKRCEK